MSIRIGLSLISRVWRYLKQGGCDLPAWDLPLRKMATGSHIKAELGRGEPIFVVGKLVAQKTARMSLGIKPVSP